MKRLGHGGIAPRRGPVAIAVRHFSKARMAISTFGLAGHHISATTR
jgi:hypothetical protein